MCPPKRRRPEETVLYQTIAAHWPAFRERMEESGRLPQFVVSEFEEYLDCGRLERGCLLLECRSCGYSQLVAFTGRLRRLGSHPTFKPKLPSAVRGPFARGPSPTVYLRGKLHYVDLVHSGSAANVADSVLVAWLDGWLIPVCTWSSEFCRKCRCGTGSVPCRGGFEDSEPTEVQLGFVEER